MFFGNRVFDPRHPPGHTLSIRSREGTNPGRWAHPQDDGVTWFWIGAHDEYERPSKPVQGQVRVRAAKSLASGYLKASSHIASHIALNLLRCETTPKRSLKSKRMKAALDDKYLLKDLTGQIRQPNLVRAVFRGEISCAIILAPTRRSASTEPAATTGGAAC